MNEKEILNKFKMKVAISNFKTELDNNHTLQKENMDINKNKSIIKSIGIAAYVLASTTGMAFATKAVYENVWKQPEKVDGYYGENSVYIDSDRFGAWVSKDIDISKVNAISEDEAREKFNEILKNFGYENEVITSIVLIDNPSNTALFYRATTQNNFLLDIDAKQPKNFKIFTDAASKDIKNCRGTKEEIEQFAKGICQKYGYDLSKYNSVEIVFNDEKPEDANIWSITYNKKYNDIVNSAEEIQIGIIPGKNELEHFTYTDIVPENTEIIISEKQAKEIALAKEKELNIGNIIKNVQTSLAITFINGNEYLRENDFEQYYKESHTAQYPIEKIEYYKVEEKRRQVWLVTLQFEIDENAKYQERGFTYFIDTTTGEIVGGM